ncbi:ABC transporter substrate-binding protein [Deinococcus yavapaiensis]|uniref:Peptide/nickel transport system substrate-binding protein n=1 Tax=Deinococcus yavapaiensis KR-236 TaxID=694435 RepID=A0A318S1Y1_9DEIO|nr:ABC transporter substrate-binding protein [Deinococcus yavapaiensis]PYE49369.1 peptide/nickel transport system substrate-binding protein [Deinococcus yavapaiensis KR-236]
MRKTALLVTLALTATLADVATAAPVRGGTLAYGRYADSLLLDPVYTDANLDIWILTNIYETLIEAVPSTNTFRGGLASSYAFSNGGKTFTVTLRKGVKFSDGSPITPADVKFSLDRARNPNNGAWNSLLTSIASISTKGSDQVVLTLKNPDPSLVAALATFNAAVLPKKLYEAAKGKDDAEKAKVFAEKPIGTGPFMLSEWKRGSYMVLKRNPYYWKKGEDGKALPYLDAIRFEILPDDNTRILKLQSGEIQGAEFIPFARVNELKANAQLSVVLFASTRRNFIVMNTRAKLKNGSANPLANEKFRQALNYATDKQALIKLVAFGNGKESKSYLASTTPLFAAQTGYPYDLAKAKSLLAASGVPANTAVTLQVIAGNADQISLATALQQMWATLGVKLNIEQLESATANGRYAENDFQMQYNYWTDDIADPNEGTAYAAVYKNAESFHTGFQNAKVDQLFAQSQVELDKTKRANLYKQIQQIYVAAAPMVFLYEQPFPVALRKNVKNFLQTPLGNNIFVNTYLAK